MLYPIELGVQGGAGPTGGMQSLAKSRTDARLAQGQPSGVAAGFARWLMSDFGN